MLLLFPLGRWRERVCVVVVVGARDMGQDQCHFISLTWNNISRLNNPSIFFLSGQMGLWQSYPPTCLEVKNLFLPPTSKLFYFSGFNFLIYKYQLSLALNVNSGSKYYNFIASALSVQFNCSVVSNSLRPHGLQHARPPCPSPTPGVYSNSCPLSRWCHPTISSSVVPFSSCLQSSPASKSLQNSWWHHKESKFVLPIP